MKEGGYIVSKGERREGGGGRGHARVNSQLRTNTHQNALGVQTHLILG